MHNTNEIFYNTNVKLYIAFYIILVLHVHIKLYNFKWKKPVKNTNRKYTDKSRRLKILKKKTN